MADCSHYRLLKYGSASRSRNLSSTSPTENSAVRPLRVALIGNPNTGKSTLFNALSGLRARTGNYPGVTVEKRSAELTWQKLRIELIDLPGTYSLAPRSPDEMLAVHTLAGTADVPAPDLVICVCSSRALERSLYLSTQVMESRVPTIVCINMWDELTSAETAPDAVELGRLLGVAVVTTSARRMQGLNELRETAVRILTDAATTSVEHPAFLSPQLQEAAAELGTVVCSSVPSAGGAAEFLALRALVDPGGQVEEYLTKFCGADFGNRLSELRASLETCNQPLPGSEAVQRYGWINRVLQQAIRTTEDSPHQLTQRLDAVLLHRFAGLAIFLAIFLLIFSTIYWFSAPLSDGVETILGIVSDAILSRMAPGSFRSLLVDGVVAGTGAFLVFLPQICLLFFFIALLEDCGYMARAAWLVDRLMSFAGLSGRSFLPLMSSFACAVPGIMATRTIENRRERMVTILIAPLMSCSARLPVYVLLIGTFVPDQSLLAGLLSLRGLTLFLISSLGLLLAIPFALLLRRTVFRGESSSFLLELPDYRLPRMRVVVQRIMESAWDFVSNAGTLIFAASILIWAAGSFPGDRSERDQLLAKYEQLEAAGDTDSAEHEQTAQRLNELNAELLHGSLLGQAGVLTEPLFRPLGWDWKISVGVLSSFPAREVIIATLGTIYSLGSDVDETDDGLRSAMQASVHADGSPVFRLPAVLSLLVFFALCAQCVSTLVVIRRETASWTWPIFSFTSMTVLAWVAAFLTYRISSLLL